MKSRIRALAPFLVFLVLIVFASSAGAQAIITFANFCDTSAFTLNGTAATLNPNAQCVLRLTNSTGQSGSAFLTNTFSLASDASFSTFSASRSPIPSASETRTARAPTALFSPSRP